MDPEYYKKCVKFLNTLLCIGEPEYEEVEDVEMPTWKPDPKVKGRLTGVDLRSEKGKKNEL